MDSLTNEILETHEKIANMPLRNGDEHLDEAKEQLSGSGFSWPKFGLTVGIAGGGVLVIALIVLFIRRKS